MSEIQECYWLTPLVKTEYSRKCFGIITPCSKVGMSLKTSLWMTIDVGTEAWREEGRVAGPLHEWLASSDKLQQ
jgi:hypothetical protein